MVMIAARATARKAKINAEDAENRRRVRGEFCSTRSLVHVFETWITLVMAFHSAGYCADCWRGFGYGVCPGSFGDGAQD